MARKRMVTRTITATVVELKCADLVDNKLFDTSITLSGTYKNNEAVLKRAKKMLDSDSQTVLQVISTNEQMNTYGMPEEEFIANASIITR